MKKYVKPYLLVLFNNTFLIMIQIMSENYEHYGPIPTIIFCLLWFLTFCILVVGVAHTKMPSEHDEKIKEKC